jgi:hypothetical protein
MAIFGELLREALDRTGRIVVALSVALGIVGGLAVSQSIHLAEGFWENVAIWTFIGALGAFLIDVFFITPLRLLRRERAARQEAAPGMFTGPFSVAAMNVSVGTPPAPETPASYSRPTRPGHLPWLADTDRHNGTYRNVQLRLVDLIDIDTTAVIAGKIFQNCVIHGPAVVLFNACVLIGPRWDIDLEVGVESAVFELTPERLAIRTLIGPILMTQCRFESTTFHGIGYMGGREHLEGFRKGAATAPRVTDLP